MAEAKTLDERLLELLELQRKQLDVLQDQKNSSETQMHAISEQIVQNRSENSSRFNSLDTRWTRVERSFDVVIAQQHHSATMIATVDVRTAQQDKRLSELSHRAIKLENGVAAIDAKTEKIQQRCATHDEKLSYLGMTCDELKDRLDDHETEGEQQFKEVSGEVRLLERDVTGRIIAVNGDTKILRTKVDQTWKAVAIIAGGLAILAGLILSLVKFLSTE